MLPSAGIGVATEAEEEARYHQYDEERPRKGASGAGQRGQRRGGVRSRPASVPQRYSSDFSIGDRLASGSMNSDVLLDGEIGDLSASFTHLSVDSKDDGSGGGGMVIPGGAGLEVVGRPLKVQQEGEGDENDRGVSGGSRSRRRGAGAEGGSAGRQTGKVLERKVISDMGPPGRAHVVEQVSWRAGGSTHTGEGASEARSFEDKHVLEGLFLQDPEEQRAAPGLAGMAPAAGTADSDADGTGGPHGDSGEMKRGGLLGMNINDSLDSGGAFV